MASGTVTITAKVDAAQAQRALELLEQDAKKLGVSYTGASNETVGAANRAKRAIDLQTQATERAKQVAEEMGKSFGIGAAGGLTVFAAAAAGSVIALSKVKEGLAYSIQAASDYESSMKTLEIVTSRTGQSFADAKVLVDRYSDSISSPDAVAQAVRVFSTMNLSMDKQSELITGIRDGLIAMGMDVNEQLPLMALAIKRQESVLLDNMGVTRTIEMMYKEYAAAIGTTVDQLTQQQKEQAVVNGVLQETATYTGVAAQSTDTYKGSVNALNAANRQLATEVGNSINPTLTTMVNLLADGVHNIATFAGIWNSIASINVNPYAWGAEPPNPSEYGLPTFPGVPGADQVNAALGKGLPKITPAKTVPMIGAPGAIYTGTNTGTHTGGTHTGGSSGKSPAQIAAEQSARDQIELSKRLQKDLSLVNKDGFERQRVEAMQEHQDRLKQAHGNAKLEAQSRKLYYAETAKIDKDERAKQAADRVSALDANLAHTLKVNSAYGGGLDKEIEKTEKIIADLKAQGPLTKEQMQWVADQELDLVNKRRENEKDIQKQIEEGLNEREQREIDTLEERARREDEISRQRLEWAERAADVLIQASETDWKDPRAIKGLAKDTAGSGAEAVFTAAGMPGLGKLGAWNIGQNIDLASSLSDSLFGTEFGGKSFKNTLAEQMQNVSNLTEDQISTIKGQIDAAKILTDAEKHAYFNQLDAARTAKELADAQASMAEGYNKMLQKVQSGDQTLESVRKDAEQKIHDYENSVAIQNGSKTQAQVNAEEYLATQLEALGNVPGLVAESVYEKVKAGDIAGAKASMTYGGQDITGGKQDYIIKTMEDIATVVNQMMNDPNRVGTSPDKPMYTVVVNQKDPYAFQDKAQYFRGGSTNTTRRFDSRGVSVR